MEDRYGYNGELHDYNNSQYLRARQYDASSGTFIQQDSYLGTLDNPMSQNRYAYVHNNPINYKDPSGHYVAFDDPDDDAVSRVVNAKQKASPTRVVKWDEGVNSHFTKANGATRLGRDAYLERAKESAKRAEEYNKSFKDKVDTWVGQAGEVGRRYYQSLIANGVTPEQAYLVAQNIKKMCDTLNTQQLTAVQEKINCMSINSNKIPEFFLWQKGEYESKDANYQVHKKEIIYSDFTMLAQASNSDADLETLGNLFVTIATTAMTAYQAYQLYQAVAVSVNAYRAYNSYANSINNSNGTLLMGDGSNYSNVNNPKSELMFKLDLQLFAEKNLQGSVDKYTIKPSGQNQGKNPLENIKYTDKVKAQMQQGDYHSFPESVKAFGANGIKTNITGGDKIMRTKIEISGNYMGKDGVFQYIIEPDGITCNHRLFVPN